MRARRPQWTVASAGTSPEGGIDPGAVETLQEIGLCVEGPARNVRDLPLERFDLIVTLCAAEDVCLLMPKNLIGRVRRAPFEDPSENAPQNADERQARYRRVRDEIDRYCAILIESLERGASTEISPSTDRSR